MSVANVDERTVEGFGAEWQAFTYEDADPAELRRMFARGFRAFAGPHRFLNHPRAVPAR